MRRMSRPKRLLAVAVACAAAMSLTGCLAGSAEVADFTREFADAPAVERLDLSTADNMPFTGGVGGTVFLRPDLDDAQRRAFSEDVRMFGEDLIGDASDPRYRIDLDGDGWRFPVLAEHAANENVLDLIEDYGSDPRVVSGAVRSSDYQRTVDHVSLVVAAPTDAFALFAESEKTLSAAARNAALTVESPGDSAVAVHVEGRPGPWLQTAREVYDGILAALPLRAFRASETELTLKVPDENDADAAATLAASLLGGAPVNVFVQSDLVTLAPGASGATTRALLSGLDAAAHTGLLAVWTDDRTASFRFDSRENAGAFGAALADAPEAAGFSTIEVTAGPADAPALRVTATPGDLAERLSLANTLAADDGVTSVSAVQGISIDLGLRTTPSESALVSSAQALRALSDGNERVCVEWPGDSLCFSATRAGDPAEIRDATPQKRAFLEAWNDAS